MILYRRLIWSRYIFDATARKPRFYLQVDGIPDGFENISPLYTGQNAANENNMLYLSMYIRLKSPIKRCISIRCTKLPTADRKYIVTTMTAAQNRFKISKYWMTVGSLIWHLWQMIDSNKTQAVVVHGIWLYQEHHMEFLFHYHHSSALERFETSELKTQYIWIVSVHICLMRHLGVRDFDKIEAIVIYP